jgi:hypothetical protein
MSKIKPLLPFLILLFAGIIARAGYALYQPYITLTPDGLGYYIYGSRLYDSFIPFELITMFRTPGYPLFIDFCMLVSGVAKAAIQSREFYQGMNTLLYFQALAGITGVIFIYASLRLIPVSRTAALIISLLAAVNPLFIGWERTLLTESLALNISLILTYLYLWILKKPDGYKMFFFLLFSVILILVRPAMILFPPLLWLMLTIRSFRKSVIYPAVISLVIYLAIPFTWTVFNGRVHGYPGFQVYGDINLLGRILQFSLPADSASGYPYLYSNLTRYRTDAGVPNPYRFLESADPDFFGDTRKLNGLSGFTHTIVLNNLPSYILLSLPDIVKSTGETSGIIRVGQTADFTGSIIRTGQNMFSLFQTLIFGGIFILIVFLIIINKTGPKTVFYTLLSLYIIALFQICTGTLLGYEDFGRLAVTSMPLLYLTAGIAGDYLFRTSKPKNKSG